MNERSSAARLPDVFRAFHHRNYRIFAAGQLVSLCGTWMQFTAQAWLVHRLTGARSPLWLGTVGFVANLPVLLLSPVGGLLADWLPRRAILLATQTVALLLALLLAFWTLSGAVTVWHVLAFAGVLGISAALDMPARQALTADLVPREDLLNAVALNSSIFNSARIVGPAFAGLLTAAAGEGWCFLINGISFVPVLAALALLRLPRARPAPGPPRSAWHRLSGGLVHCWRTRELRSLFALLGVVSLTGMAHGVLMPVFAEQILGGGPREMGLLMSSAGVGALAGALALAARAGVQGLGRWITASGLCFGFCAVLFALSRCFWLSCVLLAPMGFAMIGQLASVNTLVQTLAPDELRGRVMAIYSMVLIGLAPFGSLLAGALGQRIGAPLTVALSGAACAAAAAVFGLRARLPAHGGG